jgi:hypothetical protein
MNDCLSEEALLAQFFGEGSTGTAAHLATCAACARRYRHLRQDMQEITAALRAVPPATAVSRWQFKGHLVAAGLAAAISVFVAGWFTGSRTSLPLSHGNLLVARTEPIRKVRVPLAVESETPAHSADEMKAGAPIPASYASYVEEAFASDEDGCSQGDAAFNLSCPENWWSEK